LKADVITGEIVSEDWYISLVEECKAIITEAVFTSRWALVEGYHGLGERVVTDTNLNRKDVYGKNILTRVSKSIGVHERDLYRAIQFYKKFPDLDALPGGKNMTWKKVIALLPEPKKEVAAIPAGAYRVIYADPPWQFSNSGFEQSAAAHYQTMPTEEISKLKVPAAENCVCFMWATNAMLEDALAVMKTWGFAYKTNMVWVKEKGPTIGFYTTSRHELLLIGTRGEGMLPEIRPVSIISGKVEDHSRKPRTVHDTIEQMYKGPYLEMFAREARENWKVWGNEVS
jgi:N6-adenosine-specific RNA methylase IME4